VSAAVEAWLGISADRDRELAARLAAWRDGWQAALDYFADLIGGRMMPAHPTELERVRWHLCCGPCRRGGHRAGCAACQDRTRATTSQAHPDDYPGQDGTA
jgi:hypothetical protein